MKLQPDDPATGLWINPNWNPDQPGTFAVIIGVSRYDFLQNGLYEDGLEKLPPFDQLQVSALTAYRLFEWLEADYLADNAPLAKCWFLAAPCTKEKALEPRLEGHPKPTLANCKRAIGEWFKTMRGLHPAVAESSRSFFFFSGHGIQQTHARHLLLPADYLNPDFPNPINAAINSGNLVSGLGHLFVQQQFLYFDACRNDLQGLFQYNVTGESLLDEGGINSIPEAVYATAPGKTTYQPADPRRGYSFFGQAILDGLQGRPDLRPETLTPQGGPPQYWVTTTELLEYAKRRVAQLCAEFNVSTVPRLYQGISPGRQVITRLPTDPSTLESTLTPPPPLEVARNMSLNKVLRTESPRPPSLTWLGRLLRSVIPTTPLGPIRLFNLRTREWFNPEQNVEFITTRGFTDPSGHTQRLQVTIRLPEDTDFWLQLPDQPPLDTNLFRRSSHNWAVLLPGDPEYAIRYTLTLEYPPTVNKPNQNIQQLEAVLTLNQPPFIVEEAARLWQKYEDTSAETAISSLTDSEIAGLVDVLRKKMVSPVSATTAALILSQTRWERAPLEWLRNLSERFPEHADGLVLWLQSRLQGNPTDPTLLEDLAMLPSRGVPFTSLGLSYAWEQVQRLQAMRPDDAGSLAGVRGYLARVMPFFRPGGLFTVLYGAQDALLPELVLPKG